MQLFNLNSFTKRWFIGNFSPTIIDTQNFEIAIKHYKAGESETAHYHMVAEEVTVIVTGAAKMNGVTYYAGDIIHILPEEITDFIPLMDTITCVVKTPSLSKDKYLKH